MSDATDRPPATPRLGVRVGAVVLTLLVAVGLAVFPMPRLHDPNAWTHAMDAAHHPAAALVVAVLAWAGPATWTRKRRALAAFAAVALAAVAVEIVQPLVGRQAEWGDLLAGVIGSASAAALYASRGRRRRFARALLALTLLGFASTFLVDVGAIVARDARVPTLFAAEGVETSRVWRAVGDEGRAGVTRSARGWDLRLEGRWHGLRYEAGGQDWSSYEGLHVQAVNPSARALELRLRVDSLSAGIIERSNHTLRFEPGANHVVVSTRELVEGARSERFDLTRIDRVHLTKAPDEAAGRLELQAVWLR